MFSNKYGKDLSAGHTSLWDYKFVLFFCVYLAAISFFPEVGKKDNVFYICAALFVYFDIIFLIAGVKKTQDQILSEIQNLQLQNNQRES